MSTSPLSPAPTPAPKIPALHKMGPRNTDIVLIPRDSCRRTLDIFYPPLAPREYPPAEKVHRLVVAVARRGKAVKRRGKAMERREKAVERRGKAALGFLILPALARKNYPRYRLARVIST